MKNSYKVPAFILAGFIAFGTTQALAFNNISDAIFIGPTQFPEAQTTVDKVEPSKNTFGFKVVQPVKVKKEKKK